MKTTYKKLGSVLLVLVFSLSPVLVQASDLIFDEDLTISINSVNYTIRAGSVASSMTSISDGTVDSTQKIADNTGGFGTLINNDWFGYSVASIGDLNGDDIFELAVGARLDDTGGADRGAVYILFMNADGTVSSTQKIADNTGGFGSLINLDYFGRSISSIGDLNGDGVNDLAVGATGDDTGGDFRGAVYILFMNADGTVFSTQKIANNTGGFGILAGDWFGTSVSSVGDLNGDGITELAVGASNDSTGGSSRGAVYILFMNADGTVSSSQKIADSTGGFGTLVNSSYFGQSSSSIGDFNDDGVFDLAIGAYLDSTGGNSRGAVYILFMNANGTVSSTQKIADNTGGFGTLIDGDGFGTSISSIGDLNNDGIADLAVGAYDDTGGINRGAVYILFMNANGTVSSTQKIADNTGGFGTLVNFDNFGSSSISSIGDLNGDGVNDLAVGAAGDSSGRGAVYILFLTRSSTSNLEVTVPNNSTFTLVSSDKYQFSNDASLITNCLENESSLTINTDSTVTITPLAEVCTVPVVSSGTGSSRSSKKTTTVKETNSVSVNPPITNPAPNPEPTTYNLGTTTLKNGSSGLTVQDLQRFLNTQNFTLVVDGRFGPLTSSAVKQWQQANGLVPDGLVGPLTRGKMGANN